MKHQLTKLAAVFVALFVFTSYSAQAQVFISGNTTVNCGGSVLLHAVESGGGNNYVFFSWNVTYNGASYYTGSGSSAAFTVPNDGGASLSVVLTATSNDPINYPTSYDSRTISINAAQLATPGTLSGDLHACHDDVVTYSISPVSGATNYRWEVSSGFTMNANGNQVWWTTGTSAAVKFPSSGSISGTVKVKAYNTSNNCYSPSVTRSTAIYGGPYVDLTMQGAEEVIKNTSSIPYFITNNMVGATTYQSWSKPFSWSGSGNATSYSLTVDDQSGYLVYNYTTCGQNLQLSKYVEVTTGGGGSPIGRSANPGSLLGLDTDAVTMYPNPASGTVKFTADAEITSVEILGATGKLLVTSANRSEIQGGLNIAELQPGMYYVRIETNSGELMKTLMVQ